MSMPPPSEALARDFVHFAVRCGVLRFGEFKTKAGRLSPYFFNAGLFNDGEKLGRLGEFYARRLLESGLAFDMLFGPAYKGITLASAVAVELARHKILDLIGDLANAGVDLDAHIIATRSGHGLNMALVQRILEERERIVWKIRATYSKSKMACCIFRVTAWVA